MTSQINPNNINGNYPVAGKPNSTEGMRTNFTNTKTNFQYAADEITELQSKGVFKSALNGSVLDNNMNDNLIYAVKLQDVSWTEVQLTTTAGSVDVDYSAGQFQAIPATTGPVSLNFTNWPVAGSVGQLYFAIVITNTAHTLTFPATVNVGLYGIQGISPGTPGVSNTITFSLTGTYIFQFITSNGGLNTSVFDLTRAYDKFNVPVDIQANTVSTSTTTGALTVDGGVGIQGNINIGGNLRTYTSTGNVSFQVLDSGVVEFKTPSVIPGNAAGALNIIGSTSGNYQPVTNAGGMIHITGNDGVTSRITNDAFGTGVNPAYVGRLARGTVDSPAVPQNNDVMMRLVGSGWNGSGYGPAGGGVAPCTIDFVAKETFSGTAQGSEIQFYNAPLGSNTRTLSTTISSTGITIPGNISVSGSGGISLLDGGTVGYGTGAGGTVAQTGNKGTAVTLNKPSGEITMQATALAADTSVSFVLNNTTIGARDVLILNIVGGAVTAGTYNLDANCTSGSATITVRNITGGSLSEALVLRYVVIKGSIA